MSALLHTCLHSNTADSFGCVGAPARPAWKLTRCSGWNSPHSILLTTLSVSWHKAHHTESLHFTWQNMFLKFTLFGFHNSTTINSFHFISYTYFCILFEDYSLTASNLQAKFTFNLISNNKYLNLHLQFTLKHLCYKYEDK